MTTTTLCVFCLNHTPLWGDTLCGFCAPLVRKNGHWCASCESHRVTRKDAVCPVCEDP